MNVLQNVAPYNQNVFLCVCMPVFYTFVKSFATNTAEFDGTMVTNVTNMTNFRGCG